MPKWESRKGTTKMSFETDFSKELRGMPDSQIAETEAVFSEIIAVLLGALTSHLRFIMRAGPLMSKIALGRLGRKLLEADNETLVLITSQVNPKTVTNRSAEFCAPAADDSEAADPGPLNSAWSDFIDTLDLDDMDES